MHRLDIVANSARMRLLGIAGWLHGCSHRRKTFPFTPLPARRRNAGVRAETYVVCLDCGRHFAYDWTTMRLARQRPARVGRGVSVSTGRIS
jgi:hypothetical protein